MLKRRKRNIQKAGRRKVQDSFSNPPARLGNGVPSLIEGTEYSMDRLTRDYFLLTSLYREHWIIKRIIKTIPEDMLKNWISFTTALDPILLKRIDVLLRKTKLIDKLKEGLKWGRLYGGALGVMIVEGQGDDLSRPLNLDLVFPGDFCGVEIFDRWNCITPSMELIEDYRSPEYGLPKYYTISDKATGKMEKVHYSRCIRFIGDDLPYWEAQMEQYWGASVIEGIFDELKKRDNVSWNIAQLTFMANMRVLKMGDMGQLLSATDAESQRELYETIQAQNWLASNMGLQILDAADNIESHQYTFGGIADVYKQFMADISGAANIPATKLYGKSPDGMNATGDSDLQNYYDMIKSEQEATLRPILDKLLPVMCMSCWGAVPDDLDYEFDPVGEPSDKDRADLAKTYTDNVIAGVNAGLVSKQTALKELKQQSDRTGVWTNISDDDIQKAPSEIEDEGEMGGMGDPSEMFGRGMTQNGPKTAQEGSEGNPMSDLLRKPQGEPQKPKFADLERKALKPQEGENGR